MARVSAASAHPLPPRKGYESERTLWGEKENTPAFMMRRRRAGRWLGRWARAGCVRVRTRAFARYRWRASDADGDFSQVDQRVDDDDRDGAQPRCAIMCDAMSLGSRMYGSAIECVCRARRRWDFVNVVLWTVSVSESREARMRCESHASWIMRMRSRITSDRACSLAPCTVIPGFRSRARARARIRTKGSRPRWGVTSIQHTAYIQHTVRAGR